MQLKLSDQGPPMWFLGKPREIKISLTFSEPGPVEIDFDKLDLDEQKKILIGLKDRKLESSESFDDLYKAYSDKVSKPTASHEVKEYLQQAKIHKERNRRVKFVEDRKKKEIKFQERVKFLSSKTVRAIKATLEGEKDLRLVRALRDEELAKKRPRTSVCDYLQECIMSLQAEIVKEIGDDKPLGSDIFIPGKKETLPMDVVESEQEVVHFSPEDMIDNSVEK